MKDRVAFALAAGIAVVAAVGLYRHAGREAAARNAAEEATSAAYVVAARDLPAGTILAPEDLATARYPRARPPSSAVEAGALSLVAGQPLLRGRRAGEPILWLDIPEAGSNLADLVPVGERAVTIAVDETTGVGGLLRPRDRVDVFGILPSEGTDGTRVARLLLPNVTVLATGQETPAGGWDEAALYATVTLAVKPSEVQLVALAARAGELVLALRHPRDVDGLETSEFPDVRSEHLYAPERLAALVRQQRERIEIYKAGAPTRESTGQ